MVIVATGDGQILEQRKVLEHHGNALRARRCRARELDLAAHEAQFAAGWLQEPVDDLDERRFAGAVLAQESVDLGGG